MNGQSKRLAEEMRESLHLIESNMVKTHDNGKHYVNLWDDCGTMIGEELPRRPIAAIGQFFRYDY